MKIDKQLPLSVAVAKKSVSNETHLKDEHHRLSVQKIKDLPQQTTAPAQSATQIRDFHLSIHEKSGLLQSIVSEKLSGDIIRKMPADEYLDLVHFISEVVQDSLDKKV